MYCLMVFASGDVILASLSCVHKAQVLMPLQAHTASIDTLIECDKWWVLAIKLYFHADDIRQLVGE